MAFGFSASVVRVIWAAGGPDQDCDVRSAAMPSGYSWAPTPVVTDISERGKRSDTALTCRHPVGERAGATPAVDMGSWRSRRSTARPGKPVTSGRAAA